MNKPFNNDIEDKKYECLYNDYILKDLNEMILSNDIDIMKYLEIIVSSLLLEINKKFPEPNYSIYITYRIKSQKSDIEKLSDYIRRLKESSSSISIKDITDLIGLRIIIEKIPRNITISKNNPEYKTFKEISDEREKNIELSKQYHNFESKINDADCTYLEYYTQSKNILNDILSIFDSETVYSKEYASELKTKCNNLISECEKKLEILTALGDYNSEIDINSLENDKNSSKIDFKQLLKNFDSRIDSKLGLKLYSNALPDIVENSSILKSLGISISKDPSRIKNKRESSGYVSDFFGIDSSIIPIKTELQIMYTNEHQESIIGYSAHSKMPGKKANFMEVPSAYVNRNLLLLNNMGNSTFISNDELHLFNKICNIKNINKDNIKLLKCITNQSNVVLKNNCPIGIQIEDKYLRDLKNICTLNDEELSLLKDILYKNGCKIYDSWAKNISAYHATARLDKDSSAKNRVKIHYDDPYECLAHVIREQIDGHNSNSIDSEYYLEHVYKCQSEWLEKVGLMSTESSVMDFEIEDYTRNSLPKLLEKFNTCEIER